jgi:hypothetical protein
MRSVARSFLAVVVFLAPAFASFGQASSIAPGLPVTVLVKSPADTKTDLQIFCLFRSSPENALHGSLSEIDARLHGLLGLLRSADGFGGELGETLLLTPPDGTIAAKRVLIIGLGDSAGFTPERMYLVGKIALREADRLGVAHPFFAPTVLDGGVTGFSTGGVAEQVVRGFRDARTSELLLHEKNAAPLPAVVDFTFLAGATHAADTQAGIDRALGKATVK